MEACVESPALLAGITAPPAWAVRVARPAGDGFRMTEDLRGVPKPALQAVFGKALGRRIWNQTRAVSSPTVADAAAKVADGDISTGMVVYLSRQAAKALRERGRLAKAVGLRITHEDGSATLIRTRLARPTDDEREIVEAGEQLLRESRASGLRVASADLTMTTVEAIAVRARTQKLACSMAST
jgi:hypothetical protein